MDVDPDGIGLRIRRLRRARGLSLDQVSGLAGISKPYLSRLERGDRPLDSHTLLQAIAAALDVSVTDLSADAPPTQDRELAAARRAVPAIRLALLDPQGQPPTAARLDGSLDELARALTDCKLVDQARIIPGLLTDMEVRAASAGQPDDYVRLARVAHAVMFFLRNIGELDLAVLAAERMVTVASLAGDPATGGLAAYTHAHALAPAGAGRRGVTVALAAGDQLSGTDAEVQAARGSCLLVAASTSAALGDPEAARELLGAAGVIAARLSAPTEVARYSSFSAWNVLMHHVAVEVDAAQPDAALTFARQLQGMTIDQQERVSYLWVDVARALLMLDRHREAADALKRAERAAPLRVHANGQFRHCVTQLLDHGHRRVPAGELRGLAARCGITVR